MNSYVVISSSESNSFVEHQANRRNKDRKKIQKKFYVISMGLCCVFYKNCKQVELKIIFILYVVRIPYECVCVVVVV
jgi:hypothetical protein